MNASRGPAGEAVHTYLAAFLPPVAADALAAEQPATEDRVAALRTARSALHDRVDVTEDLELAVLVEEVGLDVDELSRLLALPPEDTRARLQAANVDVDADAASHGADASPEAGAPVRARPRRLAVVPVALFVVAAALAAVALTDTGDDTTEAASRTCVGSGQPLCITEARLVSEIDLATGLPVSDAARRRFRRGEPVRLWFAFDRPPPGTTVRVAWYRDGEPLSATSFVVHDGPHASLTLPEQRMDQTGRYRVELRMGDEVLVERSFRIVAEED